MAKKMSKAASGIIRQLQIHSEEDRKPEDGRDGIKYGVTEGLNITHFLNELFMQNYEDQLTDEEMTAIVAAEYPNRPSFQSMAAYRGYFNGGVHGHGTGSGPLAGPERLTKFKSQEEEAAAAEKREAKAAAKKKAEAPAAPAPAAKGKAPAGAVAGKVPTAKAGPVKAPVKGKK